MYMRIFYILSVPIVIIAAFLLLRSCTKSEPAEVPVSETSEVNEADKPSQRPPESLPAARLEPNMATAVEDVSAIANPKAQELIEEAQQNISAGQITAARAKLNEALVMPLDARQRAITKKMLTELAEKWLFTRRVYPDDKLCSTYKVRRGELLVNIAKRQKVPYEILLQINNISRPQELRAGETIKVINGPFHAIVYRSTFTLDLYLQNNYICTFPVGLGADGTETPTGLWCVEKGRKLEQPIWTDPNGRTFHPEDLDYPLGSRWIGLEGIEGNAKGRTGFALHGTKDANTIGTQSSGGCIRLHNGNIILLYNLLVPRYSHIKVVD